MTDESIQEPRDGAAESREWTATLAELGALPGNAWADGMARAQAIATHPRGNPGPDEGELARGVEKLGAILG